MATISGLLRPRLGSMMLDGRDLVGQSTRQILRLGVVQVPQNHSLFKDMTVRENIDLGGYTLSDRSLVSKRMDAVFDLFPQVRDWAEMKAGALSGGQQRLGDGEVLERPVRRDPARGGDRLVQVTHGGVGLAGHGRRVGVERIFLGLDRPALPGVAIAGEALGHEPAHAGLARGGGGGPGEPVQASSQGGTGA
jgi:hypothetical protein